LYNIDFKTLLCKFWYFKKQKFDLPQNQFFKVYNMEQWEPCLTNLKEKINHNYYVTSQIILFGKITMVKFLFCKVRYGYEVWSLKYVNWKLKVLIHVWGLGVINLIRNLKK